MSREKRLSGSVFGGMLLVAGSCIGAGMLALPILTGLAGFYPSLVMLVLAWVFMTFTGLLLIEINGWFKSQVNLISMAGEALGNKGKLIAWVSYLFLFYSLLVAYTAASGKVFAAILEALFGFSFAPTLASIFFTVLFGMIVYLGVKAVDLFNRALMVGLIFSYFGMIGLGLFRIDPKLLDYTMPGSIFLSLPVLVVSFGFQNMIPSLTSYMSYDLKRVRRAILGGSLITFFVYLIWSLLVLGVVSPSEIYESYLKGEEATIPLRAALGRSQISTFSQGFAFFSIVTSFLAQGLTLTHFLGDGLKVKLTKKNLWYLVLLALLPPLILSIYDPSIFFKALSFAGGICAMILFGILPISIAWIGRYRVKHASSYHVSGGKTSLRLGFLFSLLVIACELSKFFKG